MDVGHLLTSIPRQHRYQHVRPGDTVRVYYRVVEGERVRTQQLQGVVMWMTRSGPNANITIRRVIQNIGVERTFLLNSPRLEKIDVIRQGKVRRARLYYQRERTGRRARIRTGLRARRIIDDSMVDDSVETPPVAEENDASVEDALVQEDETETEEAQAVTSDEASQGTQPTPSDDSPADQGSETHGEDSGPADQDSDTKES